MQKFLLVLIGLSLFSGSLYAQNYEMKFEAPDGFGAAYIMQEDFTYTTNGLDMEGDGIFEIIVHNNDSLLVFDGVSYQLKWQFNELSLGAEHGGKFYGFYDIDNDGVREALFGSHYSNQMISFVDPVTKMVEFSIDSMRIHTIIDVNDDGVSELVAEYDDELTEKLQIWGSSTTGIVNKPVTSPNNYKLSQNYPNPFNPTTTIEYAVQKADRVQIKIYNIMGQLVRTLINENKPAGEYSITWDSKDETGKNIATGTYFYRLQVGDFISTKKMLMIK